MGNIAVRLKRNPTVPLIAGGALFGFGLACLGAGFLRGKGSATEPLADMPLIDTLLHQGRSGVPSLSMDDFLAGGAPPPVSDYLMKELTDALNTPGYSVLIASRVGNSEVMSERGKPERQAFFAIYDGEDIENILGDSDDNFFKTREIMATILPGHENQAKELLSILSLQNEIAVGRAWRNRYSAVRSASQFHPLVSKTCYVTSDGFEVSYGMPKTAMVSLNGISLAHYNLMSVKKQNNS